MLLHDPASKTNPKLVRTHSASIWCWDKPRATLDSPDSPRPGLGGSHHLPPYSILCVTPREPHPNGIFSRDSQGGVPKLSRVELMGLWTLISPSSNLWLEWGLNQSCSSPRELSNAPSHSFCRRREEVDSRLLVVGSQTASLTPGPSFAHNLGCRCPNGSCEAILDIYTSRPSNDIKNTSNWSVLPSAVELWSCESPEGLQVPTFGSVTLILTLCPKWGCDWFHGKWFDWAIHALIHDVLLHYYYSGLKKSNDFVFNRK
jgi:hypothetical protein